MRVVSPQSRRCSAYKRGGALGEIQAAQGSPAHGRPACFQKWTFLSASLVVLTRFRKTSRLWSEAQGGRVIICGWICFQEAEGIGKVTACVGNQGASDSCLNNDGHRQRGLTLFTGIFQSDTFKIRGLQRDWGQKT